MSKTPLTDAEIEFGEYGEQFVPVEHARRMEEDRAVLRGALELIAGIEKSEHAHEYCKGIARAALAKAKQ